MKTKNLKVLVLGSGAREHVLVETIESSPLVARVYWAPGNGARGTWIVCKLSTADHASIVAFCKKHRIDLVVIGPEEPLVAGIVDTLQQAGINVVGPEAFCAQLEGDKIFTREFGKRIGLPQPDYRVANTYDEACAIIDQAGMLVLKKKGLAAGKGVKVVDTPDQAKATAYLHFLESGEPYLLEEKMTGRECSIIALCDGTNTHLFPPARDYKRAWEGDRGPNTGGMGAISCPPDVDDATIERIEREIIEPTLRGMRQLYGKEYRGFLYVQVMLTEDGPKFVEFNCRFGDPEAQVILTRLLSDIVPYLIASLASGGLARLPPLEVSPRAAVCVVLASPGYPGEYEEGMLITGHRNLTADVGLYHAGTKLVDDLLFTAGGRVLSVVGMGDTVEDARHTAYNAVWLIRAAGMRFQFRNDIAAHT